MRVLYFINGFDPGGAEHGLLTLVGNGFFDGQDLRVLGMCRGRGQLAEEIAEALGDGRVFIARDEERLSLSGALAGAIALVRHLREFRPDAVILSLKQANVVGRFVLHGFPGIRCISFEHISRYRANRAEALYGFVLKALSRRVDEVWSDCRETLEATRGYFAGRKKREEVIPLFCAGEGVAAKENYSLGPVLRLSAAGRLVGRKNFDRLVDAVQELNRTGTPASLTIFGDGPEEANLSVKIAEMGLADKVVLAGYRPRWFEEARSSDIFVNVSDTEGFCIVVAEAMSVGLPVIATDVGGIREYGVHRTNMLKLGDGSVASIVSALRDLAADEAKRRLLGFRARSDIEAGYAPRAIAERGRAVFSRSARGV
ncbi:MAG: glycosyltransferase [Parvibaculum sp.]|uniref:glycosyltransferase n=1 Tax=Parvibaculum sp. TaxID=2024848 RepID=UPI00391CC376